MITPVQSIVRAGGGGFSIPYEDTWILISDSAYFVKRVVDFRSLMKICSYY